MREGMHSTKTQDGMTSQNPLALPDCRKGGCHSRESYTGLPGHLLWKTNMVPLSLYKGHSLPLRRCSSPAPGPLCVG